MRIAQIAPLFESVPPRLYGGTERVVYSLTEELVRRGHDVTLFASGDSRTSARLVPVIPQAIRLDPKIFDPYVHITREVGVIARCADQFDIIHSHIDFFPLPILPLIKTPMVTTLHGRLDLPDLPAIFGDYREAKFISISNSQRNHLGWLNWIATVYNGIDIEGLSFQANPGSYLAFLGRIAPEKGLEWAIEVAKRVGLKLRIAAKVDKVDRAYYDTQIVPLLDHPLVEYIGEVDQEAKSDFLSNARATLFPIDWPEPFGLVMVESMAAGTPVIARRRGSVPEVIVDGKTGFICDTIEDMVEAVHRVEQIDRAECRRHVEQHFTRQNMTDGYEAAYRAMIASERGRASGLSSQMELDTETILAPVQRIATDINPSPAPLKQ